MARGLWEKIEWIREQPEHVRMRYVLGYLFVSMAFVLGIWLLSLSESFQNVKQDVPAAALKSKELLPKGGVPSINSLLEQTAPLQVNDKNQETGQDYFNQQFPSGTQNEGVPSKQATP